MGRKTDRGQIVIEFALIALLFVGLFMLLATLGQTAAHENERYRFPKTRMSR
jgi:hypothetical protein